MFAIEVGQFTKAKVEKDAAKLITVFPSAKPSTRVLVLYWYDSHSETPHDAEAALSAVKSAGSGAKVTPQLALGVPLFNRKSVRGRQFTAVIATAG